MKKTNPVHSEESFLQILDAIGDMVFVKGPKSRLLWANQAFCRHYGMTNEQLRGIIDAPFSEPDHTQKFIKDDTYVFESGKILDIPEEFANRHDGVTRIFHTVKSPIFDSNKKVIMTVGISRDITDRKETEENLRAERERSIYSAKMVSLGEMAGGVAHEINTPLAVIKLLAGQCSDTLSEDKVPDLSRIKNNILKIDNTVEKISKIIQGLRTFSRDGNGDPLITANLTEVIEETLAFSREKIINRDIKFIVDHTSGQLNIECRPTQISQVILNLLNNAYDAVVDSKLEKWIKISTQIIGEQIELSVTDSGSGFTKENAEKLFRPFYTTKEIGKGTGLGLSISKGIIESHGGTISVDLTSLNTRLVIRLNMISTSKQVA